MRSFWWTAWSSRSFFHWLNPHWFLQPEIVGTYLPAIGILGWGAWCGTGPVHSWDNLTEFLPTTCGWETSLFCICALPTSLNGCAFFSSTVVRLPFNSISDCSEWLFYILVVIWCGCAKRWARSAYATILTGSLTICILRIFLKYNFIIMHFIQFKIFSHSPWDLFFNPYVI